MNEHAVFFMQRLCQLTRQVFPIGVHQNYSKTPSCSPVWNWSVNWFGFKHKHTLFFWVWYNFLDLCNRLHHVSNSENTIQSFKNTPGVLAVHLKMCNQRYIASVFTCLVTTPGSCWVSRAVCQRSEVRSERLERQGESFAFDSTCLQLKEFLCVKKPQRKVVFFVF